MTRTALIAAARASKAHAVEDLGEARRLRQMYVVYRTVGDHPSPGRASTKTVEELVALGLLVEVEHGYMPAEEAA